MPKVHIVVARPGSDRILPRKAAYLSEQLGWSLGPAPNPQADINYAMNYLMLSQRNPGFSETSVGSYFTHYDTERDDKAQLWHEAVNQSDFHITSSKLNLRWLPDNTYFAKPPVEIDKFIITKSPDETKPVCGVAGFTYGDGRKGENLIKELVSHPLSKKLNLRATGRGWPIRTEWHDWKDMPSFYQGLDVLVVPSLFEGVPMPPLEALACGIKVVIPRNVGIMDDLPEIKGIYRYQKGDAESMIEATEQAAFSNPVDRWALRNIILDNYTVEHWAEDHVRAVDDFYYGIPKNEDLPPWQDSCGVYMVAFGTQARRCAKVAINSVHEFMPSVPVMLVSTEPLGEEDLFIQHDDIDVGGRIAKLKADILSPEEWEYILYLDADTELVGDVSPLFQWLEDGWELIICKDMNKYSTANMMKRPDNQDECNYTWKIIGTREHAFQYNGGMMAFRRNNRTEEFFKLWRKEWDRWAARDQGALLRALYQHSLKMLTLFNNWNASDRYEDPPGEVAIWHHNMAARRWSGLINDRTDSEEAWRKANEWERKYGDKSPKEVGK